MDSRWRDAFQGLADKLIAEDSEQLVTKHSAYFVCGNLILSILDTIEHIEQPRGKGMEHFPVPDDVEQTILPPQRSMTPEESANLAAYHKTKFKRVVAEGDGLRDEVRACLGTLIDDICNHRTISALTRVTQLEDAIAALANEKDAPEERKLA